MYFNSIFPKIKYDPTGNGNPIEIQDILTRIVTRKNVSSRNVLFAKHAVTDAETPESLSLEYYGTIKHYWVNLMINKYYDRYYDWPMTERNLQKYVSDKYDIPSSINHYEISQESGNTEIKITVEVADYPSATPITNFEYERYLNDERKNIKVLKKVYIESFVSEFNSLLKEQLL
jgi:hypothetical protein